MSDYALTVTLKAGKDYDAPWVVVYGNTPDEVEQKLSNLGGLIEATVEAANLLKAANNAAPLVSGGPDAYPTPAPQAPVQQPAQGGWGQPAQQQAAPQQGSRLHPEGKACGCGNVLNYKSVNRKSDGKQFNFWECPARQGKNDTQHISEFA